MFLVRPLSAHHLVLCPVLSLFLWAGGCQPHSFNSASTMPSAAGAAKNDKSAQKHLYRLNPEPKQDYEVVLTIKDAPGPFQKMGWSGMYQATGCNFIVNDWAGVRGMPERLLHMPFTVRSDGSQVATVYLDAMLDEDYYGNGVCQWALTSVGPWMQASGAPGETSFSANLTSEQLQAEQLMELLYWKGYYPRADVEGFITWGNVNKEKFAEGVRDKLFSMTLKPTKVQR